MIIGPNGTGKSTIVCAIALGLGWKTAVLGRAKDVASFVKQGYEEGWIEIELKGHIGDANVVIRRSIERKSNSSEYKLNGKSASARQVNDAVANFDINVDNLCCFLPQDKVADFARMDPARLLLETERAAGDPNLAVWHQKLSELGQAHREVYTSMEEEQAEQSNLEQRNEVLSRDVERYEHRRLLEKEIALLNLQVPFAEYDAARADYLEKKAIRSRCKGELDQLKRQNRPLESQVAEMKERKMKLESDRTRKQDAARRALREWKKLGSDVERLDTDTQELHSSMDTLKDKDKQQAALVAKLRKEIEALQIQVATQPEQANTTSIENAIKAVRQGIRRLDSRCDEIKGMIEDIGVETHSLHNTKDETLRRLQNLDSARNAKFQMLRQADPNAAKAVLWLRSNQHRFQRKVFEPVMLELSVPDSRFSSYVESCINWTQMRTFVCQTRADYDVLTHELVDVQKLRLNVSELEGGRTIEQAIEQRSLSLDAIKAMGFDNFVSNLIDAPEPVLAWLYSATNLHLIPVAFQDTVNQEQVEATRQIKRYIANGSNHTIQYSEYGRKLPQTLSRDLRPARTLGKSVNVAEKQQLEDVMKDVATKLADAETKVGALKDEFSEERERIAEQQARKQELEGERIDAMRGRREWEKAKIELEAKRRRLDSELKKPSIEAERRRLESALRIKTKERLEVVSAIKDLARGQIQARAEIDTVLLVELAHASQYDAWREYLQSKDVEYDAAKTKLNDASEDFQEAKDKAAGLQRKAQAAFDAAPPELSRQFHHEQTERQENGLAPPDLEDLQSTLLEKQGELELAAGIPAGVIEAFKKRAAEIKRLEESVMMKRREVVKLEGRIERTKEKWYPALTTLVARVSERFSAAFERIGCAGEIRLSEHGDHFEKWGIDILVKFREKEQLQLLTGQRQSGGERSLSTILYLMSLTELSRSPFSLVDEINQGMDQRAERAVHDQMVEVTCQPSASQYFLITPKLLSDLRYHPKMKVLIINNGEWLPERLDLAAIAKAALARKRARTQGSSTGGSGRDASSLSAPSTAVAV